MKNSPRLLALGLVTSVLTSGAAASAQTFFAPSAMTSFAAPSKLRLSRSLTTAPSTVIFPGAVAPVVAPAAAVTPPPCAPIREVSLTPGATAWTLAPVAANACAPAASIAQGSTAQETLRVRLSTRSAVLLTGDSTLQLFTEQGAATPIRTALGACGAGVYSGVAVLDPGVYVLRAPGTAPGARRVNVEAVPVAGYASVERAGSSSAYLSTGGASSGGVCSHGDGADVRVLACPGAAATIRSNNGATVALESASGGRVCFSAPAGVPVQAASPTGRLVVVRAFAMGPSRGPVSVSFR